MSGSILSQILASVALLIITKLAGPEKFGQFSVSLSLATILSVFMTLRLEMAIGSANDSAHAIATLWFSIIFSGFIIAFLMCVLAILKYYHTAIGNLYILSLPLSLGISVTTLLQYYMLRFKDPKNTNIFRLSIVIMQFIVQCVLLKMNFSNALIYGNIFALTICACSVLFIYPELKKIDWLSIKLSISLNKGIIRYTAPAAVIGTASLQLIPILLSYKYGSVLAGQYALGYRLIGFPLSLIGASVGQAFLRIISSNKDEIEFETNRLVRKLSILSVAGFLFISLLAPYLPLLLGNGWIQASKIIPLLSLIFVINIITSPISSIPVVMNRNSFSLIFTGFEFVLRPLIILVPLHYSKSIYFIFVFALASSLLNWAYYFSVMKMIGLNILDATKCVLPVIILYLVVASYYLIIFTKTN